MIIPGMMRYNASILMRKRALVAGLTIVGAVAVGVLSSALTVEQASAPSDGAGRATPMPARGGENSDALNDTGLRQSESSQKAAWRFKSSVENLFDSPDTKEKLESLDAAFHALLNDSQIRREHKIDVLMGLLASRKDHQALYVLDNLAHLYPIERAQDLITMFGEGSSVELRSHLLATLRDTLAADWDSLPTEKPQPMDIRASEEVVFDFARKLALSDDGKSSKYAILEMTPLLPVESQEQILSVLDQERMSRLAISPVEHGSLSFDLAISNADDKSMERFRALLDAENLESEPDFLDRVLSTLSQTATDPRYKDFSREVLERTGDLTLSPPLFAKAKRLELSLQGVPDDELLPELGKKMGSYTPIERAALIIGESEALIESQDEASKVRISQEFISEAERSSGASREQLLLASMYVSAGMENGATRAAIERQACGMISREQNITRCHQYGPVSPSK